MPITKANYNLPKREKTNTSKKRKKELDRLQYEEKNISTRKAKGSFMVFREKGLEDVFVADDL